MKVSVKEKQRNERLAIYRAKEGVANDTSLIKTENAGLQSRWAPRRLAWDASEGNGLAQTGVKTQRT